MERVIRELTRNDIEAYTQITYNAYPSLRDFSEEGIANYKRAVTSVMEDDPQVTFYGLFEGGELMAVMRLFDFEMNCFGRVMPASGLGFLGVHSLHKKKGAARAMVEFYEELYRTRGIPIATLLPFRPDFYKQMGYGIGTKMNQYRIATGRIPACATAEGLSLRWLEKNDLGDMFACHNRVVEMTHGMMRKTGDEIRDAQGDALARRVGCFDEQSGQLKGYVVYQYQSAKEGNYTQNNIYVQELICEDSRALAALLGFLRRQEDQVQLVIINTEDEYFHYLFDNPANDSLNYVPFGYIESNTQGVGVMYKILDIPEAFRQCAHRDYNGVKLTLRLLVAPARSGTEEDVVVRFASDSAEVLTGSKAQALVDAAAIDVTMRVGIADFSSLFMGSASVMGLFRLGKVSVDREELLATLDRAFYYHQKPVCYTDF